MTYVFVVKENGARRTVWSPVSHAGALYVETARAAAKVYDTATGLTELASDWYAIDPAAFEAFVRRLMSTYAQTSHPEIQLSLKAVLALSTVLLERCGRPLTPQTERERAVIDEGRELGMVD